MPNTTFFFALLLMCLSLCKINAQTNEYEKVVKLKNYLDSSKIQLEKLDYEKARGSTDSAIKLGELLSKGSLGNDTKVIRMQLKAYKLKGTFLKLTGRIESEYLNISEALKYYSKSLKLAEKINEIEEIASLNSNIGTCYLDLKLSMYAEPYFLKTIDICLKSQFDKNNRICVTLVNAYHNLGSMYIDIQQKEKAITFLLKSLSLHRNTSGVKFPLGQTYYKIAKSYGFLNIAKSDSVAKYLLLAFNDLSKQESKHSKIDAKLVKGFYYYEVGKYKNALVELEKVEIEMLNNADIEGLEIYYDYMANINCRLKNKTNETRYLRKIFDLKNQRINIIANNYQIELERKFEASEKEKKLLELNEKEVRNQAIISKSENQRRILSYSIIFLVVALALLLFFLLIIRKKDENQKKTNNILLIKNDELIKQTNQLRLLDVELAKQQSRMNPHFIFNGLSSIQSIMLNQGVKPALDQLIKFSDLTRTILRNSEEELIPLHEEIIFLNQYLALELKRFATKISTEFYVDPKIDPHNTLIMPMIIQPFIENSLKHGGLNNIENSRLCVSILKGSSNFIEVYIKDNGCGFENNSLLKMNSQAIKITRKRLEILGQRNNCIEDTFLLITNLRDRNMFETGVEVNLRIPLINKY